MRDSTCFAIAFRAGLAVLALIAGCSKPDAGPKLIHTDGVTYTACGGVFSVHSPREYLESDPGTYEVYYQDPQGVKHHLTRVRTLTITNFAGDLPQCNTNP
jgi:hypothetical protein